MKVEEIERLLAEFYEGNTTESQEEALRDYFRTTEVPEHLQKDKEIFLSLNQGADRDVEVPAGLGDKLSRLIDEKAEEEQRFFRPAHDGFSVCFRSDKRIAQLQPFKHKFIQLGGPPNIGRHKVKAVRNINFRSRNQFLRIQCRFDDLKAAGAAA